MTKLLRKIRTVKPLDTRAGMAGRRFIGISTKRNLLRRRSRMAKRQPFPLRSGYNFPIPAEILRRVSSLPSSSAISMAPVGVTAKPERAILSGHIIGPILEDFSTA